MRLVSGGPRRLLLFSFVLVRFIKIARGTPAWQTRNSDRSFFERRSRDQLVAIAVDSGYAEGAGRVASYKKADLVNCLIRHFESARAAATPTPAQQKAREWLPDATLFPAVGASLLPPALVVQDELHLISGPLGTVAALYETVLDRLATRTREGKRVRPKIHGRMSRGRGEKHHALPAPRLGRSCWTRKYGARTLTANKRSKSWIVISSMRASFETPALATSTSSRSSTI